MLPLYQIIFSSACVKNDTSFVTSVTRNVSHNCNVSHIQVTSFSNFMQILVTQQGRIKTKSGLMLQQWRRIDATAKGQVFRK